MLLDQYFNSGALHIVRNGENMGTSDDPVTEDGTEVLPIAFNIDYSIRGNLLIENSSSLTNATYEMWIKPLEGFSFTAPGVSGRWENNIIFGTEDVELIYDYEDYERVHLVFCVGKTLDLYINGQLVATEEPLVLLESLSGDIEITNAIYSAVAVYDKVITADEIVLHYEIGTMSEDYEFVMSTLTSGDNYGHTTLYLDDSNRNVVFNENVFEEIEPGTHSIPVSLPPEATSVKVSWRATDEESEGEPLTAAVWMGETPLENKVEHSMDGETIASNFATNPAFRATGDSVLVSENFQKDPTFLYGNGGYEGAEYSLDEELYRSGTQSLRIDGDPSPASNSGSLINASSLPVGTKITASGWVWQPSENTGVARLRIGGVGITPTTFYADSPAEFGDQWIQVHGTLETNATGDIVVYLYGSATDESVWWDDVDLYVGEYDPNREVFSGSELNDDIYSYEWTGEPGASSSRKYSKDISGYITSGTAPLIARYRVEDGVYIERGATGWRNMLEIRPPELLHQDGYMTVDVTAHTAGTIGLRRTAVGTSIDEVENFEFDAGERKVIKHNLSAVMEGDTPQFILSAPNTGANPVLSMTVHSFMVSNQDVEYFDGYSVPPSGEEYRYQWSGSPDASVSEMIATEVGEITLITDVPVFDLEITGYSDSFVYHEADFSVYATNTSDIHHPPIENNGSAGAGAAVRVQGASHVGTLFGWAYGATPTIEGYVVDAEPEDDFWYPFYVDIDSANPFTIETTGRVSQITLFETLLTPEEINTIIETAFGNQRALSIPESISLTTGEVLCLQADWTVVSIG